MNKEINNNLEIRYLNQDDLRQLSALENATWGDLGADSEELLRRIRNDPCCTVGAFLDNKLVGSITCVQTFFRCVPKKTWKDLCKLFSSHYQGTDCLYVISLSAAPDAPRGVGSALLSYSVMQAKQRGLEYFAYGARVPGFKSVGDNLDINKYVEQVISGDRIDSVLSIGLKLGFRIGEIIADYFKDPDSRNYGVIVYKKIE